jgi:hypothetical protein
MSEYTFYVTNTDGSTFYVDVTNYNFDWYDDKAHKLSFTCYKKYPVEENAIILVSYKGSYPFAGTIDKITEKGETYKCDCKSKDALLDQRIGCLYEYPAATTITQMLSSSKPSDNSGIIGLLYWANSGVIAGPGTGGFELYSGTTYYISGGSSSSVFGDVDTSGIFEDDTPLVKGGSKSTLTVGQYYQESTGLYVRCTDDKDPKYHRMSIPNWKDTGIRLGTLSGGSTTFTTPFRVGRDKLYKEIIRVMRFGKMEFQFIYESRSGSSYVYLDGKAEVGNGSATAPVKRYTENKNIGKLEDLRDTKKVNGIVGLGYGSGYTQQLAAYVDLNSSGVWRESTYSDSHLFSEYLETTLEDIWEQWNDNQTYIVDDVLPDYSLEIGDYVRITLDQDEEVTKRVKHITIKNDEKMKLELNRRIRDAEDLIKAKSEIYDNMLNFIDTYYSSYEFHFDGNVDDNVPLDVKFRIDSDQIDGNFDYRFLLSLTIDAFKSEVVSVTTPSHSHSGHTGSGGSSSHGSAGSGGSHYHNVSGKTTGVPSSYSATIDINYPVTINSVGSHSHSGPSHSHSGPNHQHTIGYYSTTTRSGGDPSHAHSHYIRSGETSWGGTGSTGSGGTGSTSSAGSHTHSSSATGIYVASDAHDHNISGYTTGTHAGHADHSVTDNPTHTLPMHIEDAMSDAITRALNWIATGSPKHIIVTITLNNSAVPGSPFEDYYIDDTINDIDISSLVNIYGDNTLRIAISEYGGNGAVKAAINGSISSKYVLNSYI